MYHGIFKKKKGIIIKFAPINKNGEIEIEEFKKLISKKTKDYSYYYAIECNWRDLPLKDIIELAKKKKIPVLVDGNSGCATFKIRYART